MVSWKNTEYPPRGDMAFWHQYEAGVSSNNSCLDYSGNSRHLTESTNPPTLTANALNGQHGWLFNGTNTRLGYSGSIPTIKHLFCVASTPDSGAFGAFRGLVGGLSTGLGLLGSSGSANFFDLTSDYGTYTYKRSDATYANNAMIGPLSSVPYIMELQVPGGMNNWNGVQVGKDRFESRWWNGYWFETIAYASVLTEPARYKALSYFAMRYWLWPRTVAGLDVYPFVMNKARSSEFNQESYASEPYSGDPKVLVRGNFKGAYSLPFANRRQEEYLATEQFLQTHKMPTHAIMRDFRFYPPRDRDGYITSGLREQGSEVSGRFNYSFDFSESS